MALDSGTGAQYQRVASGRYRAVEARPTISKSNSKPSTPFSLRSLASQKRGGRRGRPAKIGEKRLYIYAGFVDYAIAVSDTPIAKKKDVQLRGDFSFDASVLFGGFDPPIGWYCILTVKCPVRL